MNAVALFHPLVEAWAPLRLHASALPHSNVKTAQSPEAKTDGAVMDRLLAGVQ